MEDMFLQVVGNIAKTIYLTYNSTKSLLVNITLLHSHRHPVSSTGASKRSQQKLDLQMMKEAEERIVRAQRHQELQTLINLMEFKFHLLKTVRRKMKKSRGLRVQCLLYNQQKEVLGDIDFLKSHVQTYYK